MILGQKVVLKRERTSFSLAVFDRVGARLRARVGARVRLRSPSLRGSREDVDGEEEKNAAALDRVRIRVRAQGWSSG